MRKQDSDWKWDFTVYSVNSLGKERKRKEGKKSQNGIPGESSPGGGRERNELF